MRKPLISCKNISIGYENMTVLDHISFDINEGDYLCIVGENGAGKSTLIKCLAGLKKPMNGNIQFAKGLSRRDVGYLPQQTAIQRDFPASVREVVISGCLNNSRIIPFYTSNDRKKAEQFMQELGITHLAERSYRELSGGQQQRVLLARALCASSRILILDEPVTGLDPMVTADIYQIINHINQVHKITVIMVSHDIDMSLTCASKILHVKHSVQFFGDTKDYLKSDIGRAFTGKASIPNDKNKR